MSDPWPTSGLIANNEENENTDIPAANEITFAERQKTERRNIKLSCLHMAMDVTKSDDTATVLKAAKEFYAFCKS